ncbi:riboflavin biosynthesis protein [Alicyclobacillus contaminans]|uniref:bifunctional riboflavin kinase/FAD synthetase n=1 Tax=Alicyclobacillus contaminans TaxID=392016 RepID=UPI0003FF2EC1|nr:bifunctional riboflavin kinase/FAD synthetase [Alicyclobacillus contaminans]GMA48989.1 riboflavin biosynthesis protein [Alicyclobacillus contaminans]
MNVIEVETLPPRSSEPLVLAIGKFDGVHIGHQAILSHARDRLQPGWEFGVMCFWPHPMWVLAHKAGYDRWLTPFPEKVRLLTAFGVQRMYHVHFSQAYASTTAEQFVHEHLANLSLRHVVVGFDFRFGKGGKADVEDLRRMCADIGVPVTVVHPVEENGQKVSSSQIREHLGEGRVEAAEALLGRPYSFVGTVIPGDKLGRKIGFPTANLGDLDEYVLPGGGVYAVAVEILNQPEGAPRGNWFGVMNAGFRPTVGGTTFRVEVHLLGFDGDLYGKRLRVSLLRRVRSEKKFQNVEELTNQIRQDVLYAQSMLGLNKRD